jgi:hypothetical protein
MPKPFKGVVNLDIHDSTRYWGALPGYADIDIERQFAAAMARD